MDVRDAAVRTQVADRTYADILPPAARDLFVERPVVCVQGLGFVGSAMAAAVAVARDRSEIPHFNVAGVELDTPRGRGIVETIQAGELPFTTTDRSLQAAVRSSAATGNLTATTDPSVYALADVIIVDVHLDLTVDGAGASGGPVLHMDAFREAIATIARWMRPGALIIVETTVPPGTCARIVAPLLSEGLRARGLSGEGFLLAHSYERVMPGEHYLDSIVNFWRVYAGHTAAAAEACGAFLEKVVNVREFPLRRLPSTTASETAKVLENSYRAVNIAFMQEWSRFAEAVGVDLFEVVDAIRQRPTHNNIRQPGFGVGGYCLPKDPLMALAAARQIFDRPDLDFPFCTDAVKVNRAMPINSLTALERMLGGSLAGKHVALLGISYRPDVADTRNTPAAEFIEAARQRGAHLTLHDPLVEDWPEMSVQVSAELPVPGSVDALVFATAHAEYREIEPKIWLSGAKPAVLDASNVLTGPQRRMFRDLGCQVMSIGRGSEAACAS
jgi:nucleotide sugar dehydrogenase